MAGLTAARALKEAGHSVVVFDKSARVGGRMATRCVDHQSFDHGAQYFTARGTDFKNRVQQWQADGIVAEWGNDRFVGTGGMSGPARAVARGLDVIGSCEVTALRQTAAGWSLESPAKTSSRSFHRSFSAIVLALPAPQALKVLATTDHKIPKLEHARYAPCWAATLAFSSSQTLPFQDLRPNDDMIAWIARDSSKPGRLPSPETFVIHATPAWSRANLEVLPDDACTALLTRFRVITGFTTEPTYAAAHRWRYALVEQPANRPYLWLADANIGACGDWCLGPRVESAYDSGRALAHAILQQMEIAHGDWSTIHDCLLRW